MASATTNKGALAIGATRVTTRRAAKVALVRLGLAPSGFGPEQLPSSLIRHGLRAERHLIVSLLDDRLKATERQIDKEARGDT